ncbi:putative conserved protein UCP016719 [Gemmatirosa kalamazoonensis]|uniref:Putative conserved protein UCP016719 n=1 Tax=Gemmatirosa kalamazoonensis TaxID=861299 RepID=W0RDC0_9BACT|nr:DUF1343 domain-containing protein [Gemmatirosa kalamazoonensis]AHG89114.1 putative conserved protein UCP016719 [Gemmatirosa kalamazoonensis]
MPRLRTVTLLATLVAAPLHSQPVRKDAASDGVVPGIEVLLRDSLHLVRGKRVGLVTNHSGRDRSGTSTIDRLAHTPGVTLTALFALEHGIRGAIEAGGNVSSTRDSATGVPIYSLYGASHVPTAEMLRDVDVILYDIQDVGARVYTYQWGMAIAADSADKPFIVLDRPDPVRADLVQGGVLDPKFRSYVGAYPVALRYGLTPGELLRYLNGTGQIHADVKVVPMAGYRRAMWYDDTKLAWVNPSPNLRDLDATIVYTGTVFFEGTNVSEGRGTDQPFRLVGASWLTDAGAIAAELNAMRIPGVRFDSVSRTMEPGFKFPGQTIPMLHVSVTDRDRVNAPEVGLRMLRAIYARHKPDFQWRPSIDRLAGGTRVREAVENDTVDALLAAWAAESRRFQDETRRYWIYK